MAPKLSRRRFLQAGAASAVTAVLAGCQFPTRWVTLEPYVRPPEEQLAGEPTWYASTCRQCPAGCGIIVRIMNGRALKIEGNAEHPLNRGKLCPRGQAGLQLLYNPDRLTSAAQQAKRGSRQWQPVTWANAIKTLQDKIQGAGSGLAIWVGSTTSGHLIDLFSRLAKGLGAPGPIQFDQYTAFHGYPALQEASQTLFGRGDLPTYDISHADVVFSFGADFLGTWLSTTRYGAEFGNFRSQGQGKRGYLVQFEPRMAITGAKADRWVATRPGAEAQVAAAIARLIADQNLGGAEKVGRAKTLAGNVNVGDIASANGLTVQDLTTLARTFAQAGHAIAIPGSSLAGHDNAAQAIAAVQALNTIAGSLGQTGGLALSPASPAPELVRRTISPYSDVQKLIENMRSGQVKALLVYGVNPLYEFPQSGLADALARVPFVASFAPIVDETAVQADLVLPDRTYLESWGYEVVSPSFGTPIVNSQQPVVPPVVNARATGDVLLTVARGIPAASQALQWNDEVAFLKETIAKLPPGSAGGSNPDELWSRFLQHGGWWPGSPPPAAPLNATATSAPNAGAPQFQGDPNQYPYFLYPYMSVLVSDGRGASQPWLQGSPQPMTTVAYQTLVEIHPETAKKLGVKDYDVVKVTSPQGEIEAIVYTYPAIRQDTVAIATGEGHTDWGRYARNQGSNVMNLVSPTAWSTQRVKITPTGRKEYTALFEYKPGVQQGFINAAFPG